jgi:hypothetical protein
MKMLTLAALGVVSSATTALAGAVTYVAPAAVAIEEPARMGGSGAWIIPLVIVAVLALALSKKATTPLV